MKLTFKNHVGILAILLIITAVFNIATYPTQYAEQLPWYSFITSAVGIWTTFELFYWTITYFFIPKDETK